MKLKEYYKELQLRSESELHRILAESREKLRDLRFKASQNQLKEVRKIRETKKGISQILTILNSKKNATSKALAEEVVDENK